MATIREDNGDARSDDSTQYTIEPGDIFQGTLETTGDTDWIKIELSADTIYDIRLDGLESHQFRFYHPSGASFIYGPYLFSYSTLFRALESGTYYIALERPNDDDSIDYEISFVEKPLSTASYDEIAAYLIRNPDEIFLYDIEPGGTLTANITDLNPAGQQLARWALEAWTYMTGIKFEFVDDDAAHIKFDDSELGTGFNASSISNGARITSRVNIGSDWLITFGSGMDSFTFFAYLHEIGHALGLNHPGPYTGLFPITIGKIFGNDSYQTTVMSYFHQDSDNHVNASFAYPVTPMIADIIAIHDLYGKPVDINAGDTVYGHGSNVEGYLAEFFKRWTGQGDSSFGNPVTLTLYDSDGVDTLDLSTDSSDQRVDLRPEGISDVYGLVGNLIIARDTLIENFIAGSGDDIVTGNDEANYLQGRDGNDELQGNGGNDVLEGGAGADRHDGGAGMDWVSYQTSNTAVTINLARGTLRGGHAEGDVIIDIENVIGSDYGDVLEGDSGANWFDGGPGNDEISGNDGDDVLEGSAGADRLSGGVGEDTASYEQSDAAVTVRLHSGVVRGGDAEGDTFGAMVTVGYTDSNGEAQQETVPDIEHIRGSAFADVLAGDSRANRLEGGGGADRLYGGPGGGDDELWGGAGEDALFGGSGNDVLEGGPGADTLKGGTGADTASYAQSDAGVTVRLHDGTARGGHAEGDDIADIENVSGSAHADILEGDESANRLDGGAGVDWLSYAGSDGAVSVRLYDGYAARGHAEGDIISGFENLRGSGYPDALSGSGRANRLEGGAGADQIWGGSGDDVLEGGAGADRLHGGRNMDTVVYENSDTGVIVNLEEGTGTGGHAEGDTITDVENIVGSNHDDVLTGDENINELVGGHGDDELWGNAGNDLLEGGAGADRLEGGTGMDTVVYGNSDEAVTVNLSNGTLFGGHAEGDVFVDIEGIVGTPHGDTLIGDDGVNLLDGLNGDDVLEGGAGADRLDGGAGKDTAIYRNSNGPITVNLAQGIQMGGHAEGDVLANIENIEGSTYDDELTGDSSSNRLDGGDGNDELRGGDDNDQLYGGDGNDLLEGGEGIDFMDGGSGIDTVSYANSTEGMEVHVSHKASRSSYNDESETLINIENVIGSRFQDSLDGSVGANDLYGRRGNDRLYGDAGEDRLFGEEGDDRLVGSEGADMLYGGEGTDTVVYWFSDEGVTVNLMEGTGQGGYAEGDRIFDIENIWGSNHADILLGDNGPNRIYGVSGNDEVNGNGGDDVLVSGSDPDLLNGGPGMDTVSYERSQEGVTVNLRDSIAKGGNAEGDGFIDIENIEGSDYDDILVGNDDANRLNGRFGNNTLEGGGGADHFIFDFISNNEIILDFTDNEDLIDLTVFWNISSFDDLTITSDSEGVTIDLRAFRGGTILLEGFDIANLDASDFIF